MIKLDGVKMTFEEAMEELNAIDLKKAGISSDCARLIKYATEKQIRVKRTKDDSCQYCGHYLWHDDIPCGHCPVCGQAIDW